MSTYAWIIDTDHLADPGVTPPSYQNAAGLVGPRDATAEQINQLAMDRSKGHKFRVHDDDGELYYEGRFLGDHESEDGFGPLWDFAEPNAGATEIRYKYGNKWVQL